MPNYNDLPTNTPRGLDPFSTLALETVLAAVDACQGITEFQIQQIINLGRGMNGLAASEWLDSHGFVIGYNDWRNRGREAYYPANHPALDGKPRHTCGTPYEITANHRYHCRKCGTLSE